MNNLSMNNLNMNNLNMNNLNIHQQPNLDPRLLLANIGFVPPYGANPPQPPPLPRKRVRKRMICGKCGKNLASASTLKLHMKQVHDKIRDHACTYCEKVFSARGDLVRHVISIHEQRYGFNYIIMGCVHLKLDVYFLHCHIFEKTIFFHYFGDSS